MKAHFLLLYWFIKQQWNNLVSLLVHRKCSQPGFIRSPQDVFSAGGYQMRLNTWLIHNNSYCCYVHYILVAPSFMHNAWADIGSYHFKVWRYVSRCIDMSQLKVCTINRYYWYCFRNLCMWDKKNDL